MELEKKRIVERVEEEAELSFLAIQANYPDRYILVRIVRLDYSRGIELGVPLYTGDSMESLGSLAVEQNILNGTVVLQGNNLLPVIGGIL